MLVSIVLFLIFSCSLPFSCHAIGEGEVSKEVKRRNVISGCLTSPREKSDLPPRMHLTQLPNDLLGIIVSYLDITDSLHLAQTTHLFFNGPCKNLIVINFSNFEKRFKQTFKIFWKGDSLTWEGFRVRFLVHQLSHPQSALPSQLIPSSANIMDQFSIILRLLYNLSVLSPQVFYGIINSYPAMLDKNRGSLLPGLERILCYELERRKKLHISMGGCVLPILRGSLLCQKNKPSPIERLLISVAENTDLEEIITDSKWPQDRQELAFTMLLKSRPFPKPSSRNKSRFKVLARLIGNAKCLAIYKYQAASHILSAQQPDVDHDFSPSYSKPSIFNRDLRSDYDYSEARIMKTELVESIELYLPSLLENLELPERQVLQHAMHKNNNLCSIM